MKRGASRRELSRVCPQGTRRCCALQARWEDFRTSNDPGRRARSDLLYLLDAEGDQPLLWLNAGIDHLAEIAHAPGPRGRRARIRDATFAMILSQAWTSLVSVAITRLGASMAVAPDADAALDSLTPWDQGIVREWAPALVEEATSDGEAIRELAERAITPSLVADVQDRLSAAIQERVRPASAFRGLGRLPDPELDWS